MPEPESTEVDMEFKGKEEMDAKLAQANMTARHEKEQEADNAKVTLDDLDKEPVMLEGGDKESDDEWSQNQEGADLEYTGDKKEEEKVSPDGESEEKVETKKELTEEEKVDAKVKEDIIKYLDEEGGGTKYVIKGKEYDLRDLSPQEIKDRYSKAGRFYERMEELAAKDKQISERERLAEEGARRSQDIMRRYDTGKTDEVKIPKAFQVNEDDTDAERALKEGYAEMYTKMQNLEQGYQQQAQSMTQSELYRQLDSLEREFPLASKEEIIAVKCNYPDADMRTIAENSQNNRMSDAYLDAVLQARPDKLREIEEKGIERHLAKKQKATRVSRKTSSSTVSSKSSEKKTTRPRTLDEIEDQLEKDKENIDFSESW